ncbi:MAG: NifU N-terminal domain-containing protein [Saprospiraceae bacterium]|nr:NifU N-terminal domain-containing protein [Saprospiraceae bacterium]
MYKIWKQKQNQSTLYTEQTPNPETLKFVSNKLIYRGIADLKTKELADEFSPLAAALL